MNATKIILLSFVITLPALLLSTCGFLFLGFGIQSANDLIGAVAANPVGKILFSPGVVLGGPLVSLGLNLSRICRISAGYENSALFICFWIARSARHFIPAFVSALLLIALLSYAFLENFRIIAR